MRRSLSIALGLSLTGTVLLACQLILDAQEPVGRTLEAAAPPDTGPPPTPDPCTHQYPPPIPNDDDDNTGSIGPMWFAAERVILPFFPDAGVQPGVDLDKSCTCHADLFDGAAPCTTPTQEKVICDFEGGVDDSLGRMSALYANITNVDVALPINREIADGSRTLLLYVDGYNGRANDRDVTLSFVPSGGLYSNLGCNNEERDAAITGFPEPDSGLDRLQYAPIWDGCDRWSPSRNLTRGLRPQRKPSVTTGAYVSNYVIVSEIREVNLSILGEAATAGYGYFIARMIPQDQEMPHKKFRVEGFIAGRMLFDQVVRIVGRTQVNREDDSGTRTALCETPVWQAIKGQLCAAADTMDMPVKDHQGAVCNAATATVGFIGRHAQVDDFEFENPTTQEKCTNPGVFCQVQ
jgi:hypothetical protein